MHILTHFIYLIDCKPYIDEGGLRFGSGYSPIKYQYGSSASGPWHDEMAGNDKYRRDSLDGGTSWGTPYQFVGTDGKNGSNGSDASVTYSNIKRALQKAANISDAYMTMDDIGAPTISGGKIIGCEFLGGDYKLYSQNGAGAFTLIGDYGSDLYEFLKIEYSKLPTPRICIFSPAGAEIEFGKTRNGRTSFYGAVNFSDATVTGITATFA